MRLSCTAVFCLALALICLVPTGQSYASVVKVDVTAKSATSDVSTLDPKGLKIAGEQIGLFVRSTILEPQKFTLRVSGLKNQDYDFYLNQSFKWTKPARDLEAGIEVSIDGRVVDSAAIKCLQAVQEPIKEASKKLAASDGEAKRVYYTLSQASGWASSALSREQAWRSAGIIVAPSGKMLRQMSMPIRQSDTETASAVTRACWLLQQARDRMFHAIKDPVLRNQAVVAMTPVDFAVVYSSKNGRPHIEAAVANKCNLPISGTVSMALPAKWKTTAKKLTFKGLKPGETFKASFDLVAPMKDAIAPDKVPMAANLTVIQDQFTAALKLTATAQAQPK